MDIKAVLNSLANNGTLVQLGLPPDNATMKARRQPVGRFALWEEGPRIPEAGRGPLPPQRLTERPLLRLPSAPRQVPILSLVLGQKRVVGSVVGGRSEMNEMLQFCAQTGIRPMIEKRKLKCVHHFPRHPLPPPHVERSPRHQICHTELGVLPPRRDVNKAIEYLLSGKPRYRIVLESE